MSLKRGIAQTTYIGFIGLAMLRCSRPSNGARSASDQARAQAGHEVDVHEPSVPALPPESVPAALWRQIHKPENMIQSSPEWGVPFPRDIAVVAFKEEATQTERQQAIDAIGGEVIGGERVGRGGYYYVRIHSDGTAGALFRAIAKLKTFPQVELASPEPPQISPERLRRS